MMCTSRMHRVLGRAGDGTVLVEDLDGNQHRVSLLALDSPAPEPGDWLVVHSGYAIDRIDTSEAESVVAEIRAAEGDRGAADEVLS